MSWRSDFAKLGGAISDIEDHCVAMDDEIGELKDILDQRNAEIENLQDRIKDLEKELSESAK